MPGLPSWTEEPQTHGQRARGRASAETATDELRARSSRVVLHKLARVSTAVPCDFPRHDQDLIARPACRGHMLYLSECAPAARRLAGAVLWACRPSLLCLSKAQNRGNSKPRNFHCRRDRCILEEGYPYYSLHNPVTFEHARGGAVAKAKNVLICPTFTAQITVEDPSYPSYPSCRSASEQPQQQ